jgi:hypothetical protein
MKIFFAFFISALGLISCGSNESPVEKAQNTLNSVKKSSQGKIVPVIEDVTKMANSTQAW